MVPVLASLGRRCRRGCRSGSRGVCGSSGRGSVGRRRISSRSCRRAGVRRRRPGHDRQELREVGRAEPSDGVPACGGGEALRTTAGVAALGDIVERGGAGRVQHGVEEAEGGLALVEELVVEERDDGRERGRRRGRARYTLALASDIDDEVDTLGGDVGEGAALSVEEAGVSVSERLEVGRDSVFLVVGLREDVGEATRREVRGLLIDALRAADRGQADEEEIDQQSQLRGD